MNTATGIKYIYLVGRGAGIEETDFPRQWRRHAALAATFPSVGDCFLRVLYCTKVGNSGELPLLSNDRAGVALLWMTDLDAALNVTAREHSVPALDTDERRVFGELVRDVSLLAEERILLDGPLSKTVLIEFLGGEAGRETADVVHDWERAQQHLLQSAPASGVCRVAVNVTSHHPPGFDWVAVGETWFAGEAEAQAWLQRAGSVRGSTGERSERKAVSVLAGVTHAWEAKGA